MPGFVCFMDDGTRIVKQTGANGQVDSNTNSNANTALYSMFATSHEHFIPTPTSSSAIFQMCAGFGSLMTTYPTATQNGKFSGIFLSIFHLGCVVCYYWEKPDISKFSRFNGAIFNIRARGLNNVYHWLSKIYTRESVAPEAEKMDIYDHGYVGRMGFYIFCGILDAMWQTTVYWLMGPMLNDPSKLAFFAGFYKSIQSAGATGIWRADTVKISLSLSKVSCLRYLWLFFRIKDHTDLDDETITRMDDRGHIPLTEAGAAEMKATQPSS
ncbi:hypothetical protein ARMSODRAFT_982586 [Armillaria solidipes]|uniref:Uncharacterized protein n=1 Tax=Armillaria solidipes TaxID=1076256 RepID=A0A2H3AMC5_9AGAR|nr:hypothetical protein ARMSODRAFT_982586 [Armillaria solidipes]